MKIQSMITRKERELIGLGVGNRSLSIPIKLVYPQTIQLVNPEGNTKW